MISFFRRALSSWIVLGLLALVMIGFIITGVERPGMFGGATADGGTVAKVEGQKIGSAELLRRIQNQFDVVRRQRPDLDRKAFIAAGGFEGVTDGLISARATESWGKEQGFAISKRLIDAQIAGMTAFHDVTGVFSEGVMRNQLAQAGISEKELRADIAGEQMRDQILTPAVALAPTPAGVGRAYAKLLLELREGQVGIIPLAAFIDPTKPSDAEIAAAYKADIATYTRPEARVLRYALFGIDQVSAQAAPTEDEIAGYYQDNAAIYSAHETRALVQVITPSETLAKSIAASARSGTQLWAAASKAGLEASTLKDQNRDAYAEASGKAVADQAFAAAKGSVIGPVKGSFGWYVVRVEDIKATPGRPLADVRPEIVALLTKQKAEESLSDLAGKIEDSIADGASFAEIAENHKLTIVETPAILSDGRPIEATDWKAPTELSALLKTGFEASPEDRPSVETVVRDQTYALLSIAKVVPPTPLPLAEVRDAVARNIITKRAAAKAKAVGDKVVAAVNKGVSLGKALNDAGTRLPPPQPARARQLDLARAQQNGGQIPEPVRAMFALQKGKAKLIPGDQGNVLFVTVLDKVIPGDLKTAPGLVDQTRQDLAQAAKAELGDEFMRAISQDVDIKRYPEAMAAAKRRFDSGQ